MVVEITSSFINNKSKVLVIEGHNTDDLHLQGLERGREDRDPETLKFIFDTTNPDVQKYIVNWLHRQKVTKGSKTYGEAVRAVVGTVTSISGRYIAEA